MSTKYTKGTKPKRGRTKLDTVHYQMQDAVINVYLVCLEKKCVCCIFVIFVDNTFFHYVRNISYMVSRKRFFNFARIRVCLS